MTFVLVDKSNGKKVDQASTMSELEAAKHSQAARSGRSLDSWAIMPIADFNAFNADGRVQ